MAPRANTAIINQRPLRRRRFEFVRDPQKIRKATMGVVQTNPARMALNHIMPPFERDFNACRTELSGSGFRYIEKTVPSRQLS
jgi:hypothetical protein